jgi:hypothetical protein
MKIKFIDTLDIDKKYQVVPAGREMPQWYKDADPYIDKVSKLNSPTIKKCLPVFDAITAGYIIKNYVDIYVHQENGHPYFSWKFFNPIDFHNQGQASTHPLYNDLPYPKWMSPWSIITEPGYSCLFIEPMHRENEHIKIFPGVVDTDKFFDNVNIPFVLKNKNWEGIIPAGTPIVQVIPFKRESFTMGTGNKKDIEKIKRSQISLRSLFINSYKKQFWTKKNFS